MAGGPCGLCLYYLFVVVSTICSTSLTIFIFGSTVYEGTTGMTGAYRGVVTASAGLPPAQGCLPLAKLCALVTMRRVGTPGRGQPFTIPLTPTEREGGGEETGELHVRVAYSCEEEGQGGGAKKDTSSSLITLSVDVLRACGLKEAAEMCAAEREPLIMGQPARDGVNALVRLRLPQGIIRVCNRI